MNGDLCMESGEMPPARKEIQKKGGCRKTLSPPLSIGALAIPIPFVLAPMAGYTDSTFRALCRACGCGLVFTEIISAAGIVFRNPRTLAYLHSVPEERPLAVQIYDASPAILTEAAQVMESIGRFDLLDINCGCPVPKIMRKGGGAALMNDPEKIYRIVKSVSEAISLPVTVKTRIGLSPEHAGISEVAQAVEEGGASALFLHARFASVGHSGPADWEAVERIAGERTIPVIGNGGVTTGSAAIELLRRAGIAGVMIGRGAIGNPWIFEEAAHLSAGRIYTPPTAKERSEMIAQHLRSLYTVMEKEDVRRKRSRRRTEPATCHRFRGHLVKYLHGVAKARSGKRLLALESIESILFAVDEILQVTSQNQDCNAKMKTAQS